MLGTFYFVPYVPLSKVRDHCYGLPCPHPHRKKDADSPRKPSGEEAREIVRMLRRAHQSEYEREVLLHQAWVHHYHDLIHREMGDYGFSLAMFGDKERGIHELFHEFDLMKRRGQLKKEKEEEKKGKKDKDAGAGKVYRVKNAIYVHIDDE